MTLNCGDEPRPAFLAHNQVCPPRANVTVLSRSTSNVLLLVYVFIATENLARPANMHCTDWGLRLDAKRSLIAVKSWLFTDFIVSDGVICAGEEDMRGLDALHHVDNMQCGVKQVNRLQSADSCLVARSPNGPNLHWKTLNILLFRTC